MFDPGNSRIDDPLAVAWQRMAGAVAAARTAAVLAQAVVAGPAAGMVNCMTLRGSHLHA